MVIILNGVVTDGVITNLSATGKLRVELEIMMPYEEYFTKIRGIIRKALDEVAMRLSDEPIIEIHEFDESGLELDIMPFATDKNYWDFIGNLVKPFMQRYLEKAYEFLML